MKPPRILPESFPPRLGNILRVREVFFCRGAGGGLLLLFTLVAALLPARAATITVTNLNDTGPGSLRAALASAASNDTVNITSAGTILLADGPLLINKPLTVTGPGATNLVLSGNQLDTLLRVEAASNDAVRVSGIKFTAGRGPDGGAVCHVSGVLSLNACVFTDNVASTNAFNGSSALPGNGNGGAIVAASTLNVTNCVFSQNTANGRGGAIVTTNAAAVSIHGTTFDHNRARVGGALAAFSGTHTLVNCTFSDNQATNSGGAIDADPAAVFNVTSCTLASNDTGGNGGGISARSPFFLKNTLVAGNRATNSGPDGFGPILSGGHNLIQDTNGCVITGGTNGNLFGRDPLLGPLTNNGGPTWTRALLPASPAIDAGDNTGVPATDQRGFPRIVNGVADIGAFEAGLILPPTNAPAILVMKICPNTVTMAGGSLTYTGSVKNVGDIVLTNVVVTSDRPNPNTAVTNIPSLPVGAMVTFTGSYAVPAGLTNCTIADTLSARAGNPTDSRIVTNSVTVACPVRRTLTITCPTNITVQCLTNVPPCPANIAQLIAQGGNVSDTNVSYRCADSALSGGTCGGVLLRTNYVSDACSNTMFCVQTITVRDTMPPVISCPTNIVVAGLANVPPCPTTLAQFIALGGGASDNCDTNLSYACTDGPLIAVNCGGLIHRTHTVTDDCSNSNSCVQVIFVNGSVPPTLVCPPPITVECLSQVPACPTNLLQFIAAGGQVAGTNLRYTCTDSALSGSPCSGTIQRTHRLTDACTNTVSCVQVIVVRDTTPPVIACAPNRTLEWVAGAGPVFDPPTVSDTCDANVTVTFVDSNPVAKCPAVRIFRRTWTATDACTNRATCAQTISFVDTPPPVLVCSALKTVECGAVWAFDRPGALDNSDGTNITVVVVRTVTNSTCGKTFVATRTWKATDKCGNSATCTQAVTVVDTTRPTITCPPTLRVSAVANIPPRPTSLAQFWARGGQAADHCDPRLAYRCSDSPLTNGPCGPYLVRTHTVTDDCTNAASCFQTILVTAAPLLITCPPALNVACLGGVPACPTNLAQFVAAGGMAVGVSLTYTCTDEMLLGNSCRGTIARRHRLIDGCGEEVSCVQTIRMGETAGPILLCPTNRTVAVGAVWSFDSPTAIDLCSGSNVAAIVLTTATNPVCGMAYRATRTWQATDACTNRATCSQTITVVDTTPPVMFCAASKTVECGTAWSFDAPTAFDSCDGLNVKVVVERTDTNLTCGKSFLATRTWRAIDSCTNSTTCTQVVTVVDTTAPTITCPPTIRVTALEKVPRRPASLAQFRARGGRAEDNCGPQLLYRSVDSPLTNCPCGSYLIRTHTITDACANEASCAQTIVITTNAPPTITCPPNRTVAGSVAWAFDLPTATDHCADAAATVEIVSTVTNRPVPFRGSFTVTRQWQAKDVCRNTATCTQSITVKECAATPLEDQTVCEGGEVSFCTTVSGAGPFTKSWLKDGVVLPGATNACHTIQHATNTDAGTYAVVITGPCGSLTNRATLTVGGGAIPIISISPGNTVCEGETVRLSLCNNPNYANFGMWFRDGNLVDGILTNKLVLANVKLADAGDYSFRIIATNGTNKGVLSPNTTVPARLRVRPVTGKIQITSQPRKQSVGTNMVVTFKVGANTDFTCDGVRDASLVWYQWRLNGVNLTNRPTSTETNRLTRRGALHGAFSNVLTIANVQPADAGAYDVVVWRAGEGAVQSAPAVLTVTNLAPVTSSTNLGTLAQGYATNRLAGTNRVAFAWKSQVDGIAIFTTAGSAFDTHLTVWNGTNLVAQDDDRGGFATSLVRFNARSNVSCQIAVGGMGGGQGAILLRWGLTNGSIPAITSHPEGRRISEDAETVFTVTAMNLPPANNLAYQWFFNGAAVAHGTNATLSTTDLHDPANALNYCGVGKIWVEVSNSNSAGEFAISEVASLERKAPGDPNGTVFSDKFETMVTNLQSHILYNPFGSGFAAFSPGRLRPGLAGPPIPDIPTGASFFSPANGSGFTASAGARGGNFGGRNPLLNCQAVGGNAVWFVVTNSVDGALIVDTVGSDIPTLLSVYQARPGRPLTSAGAVTDLDKVICSSSDNGAGRGSSVLFQARKQVQYVVAVDGYDNAVGCIQVNVKSDLKRWNWVALQPRGEGWLTIEQHANHLGRVLAVFAGTSYTNLAQIVVYGGVPDPDLCLGPFVGTTNTARFFVTSTNSSLTYLVAVEPQDGFTGDLTWGFVQRFDSPYRGPASIDLAGNHLSRVLGVFEGNGCPFLKVELANSNEFFVKANTPYFVAVERTNNSFGELNITQRAELIFNSVRAGMQTFDLLANHVRCVLAVYAESQGTNLVPVPFSTSGQTVTFPVTSNTTYRLVVVPAAGFNGTPVWNVVVAALLRPAGGGWLSIDPVASRIRRVAEVRAGSNREHSVPVPFVVTDQAVTFLVTTNTTYRVEVEQTVDFSGELAWLLNFTIGYGPDQTPVVSWEGQGFSLEGKAELEAEWLPVAVGIITEGTRHFYTNSFPARAQSFYRLRSAAPRR